MPQRTVQKLVIRQQQAGHSHAISGDDHIVSLTFYLGLEQVGCHHRGYQARNQRRKHGSNGNRHPKGLEKLAGNPAHKGNRQKYGHNCCSGGHHS